MASDDGVPGSGPAPVGELVELRPAPAVVLRHRDADLEVVTAPRTGPRVELRRGALWVRAGEEGPGVTVTHGAASVQVRAGAGVVEVLDLEALLVVASGRAAVKGVSPLPRSVIAGQAVTLTLDGTFTDPDPLSAAELAADRMVVENLALDNLASGPPAAAAPAAPVAEPEPVEPAPVEPAPIDEAAEEEAPAPSPDPAPPAEARVDPPHAPQVEGTDDPFAPRVRPEVDGPSRPVGRPAPSRSTTEASALATALAGVGVTDELVDPSERRAPVAPEGRSAETTTAEAPSLEKGPPRVDRDAEATAIVDAARAATATEDSRRRQRILIYLVVGALIILGIVAAVVFSADSSAAAGAGATAALSRRFRPDRP